MIQDSNKLYCFEKESASSAKDCKDLKLDGDGNHCCYFKVKGENGDGETQKYETCIEITDKQYDKIDDYIDEYKDSAEKDGGKIEDLDIDCNSSFLTNSLLGIILFLL